jgi:hypothetical protein
MAGDRAGNVHVLWVEDSGGETNNLLFNADGTPQLDFRGRHINLLAESGNTLSYTRWDGQKWLIPTEVQVSSAGRLNFPSAAVDTRGILHVIWFAGPGREQDMFYSSAPADSAEQLRSWSQPVILTGDILTAYYPSTLTADSTGGLHIAYYQVGANPGVFSISSFDGGQSWEDPVQIYANFSTTGDEDGSMPVRLMVDAEDRLHATWTRYDLSGNGKAVYYAQSLDQGQTWSEPFEVATWRNGLYEMDWLSAGVSGDEIHLVWEGGERAFTNERVSYDGGLTWTEPQRIMNRLVGENGYAELVTDSAGGVHLIVVKRIDGNGIIVYGPWYSTFENGFWKSPYMIGVPSPSLYDQISQMQASTVLSLMQGTIMGDGLRYPRSVIVNGNELFLALVNEFDGEIYATRLILDTPALATEGFEAEIAVTPQTPTDTAPIAEVEPTPQATIAPAFSTEPEEISNSGIQRSIYLSLIPVIALVLGAGIYSVFARRR